MIYSPMFTYVLFFVYNMDIFFPLNTSIIYKQICKPTLTGAARLRKSLAYSLHLHQPPPSQTMSNKYEIYTQIIF